MPRLRVQAARQRRPSESTRNIFQLASDEFHPQLRSKIIREVELSPRTGEFKFDAIPRDVI